MKAICTNNAAHTEFLTTAHVMEEWRVDSEGNWIETTETIQIDHGPDPDNYWNCAICGAYAMVVKS
jgi:hypothetical protein